MKKYLVAGSASLLIAFSSFAQNDDVIRRPAIGISFVLNDYETARLIRSTSLSAVLRDDKWTRLGQMTPGLAFHYFQGIKKHIDVSATLAASFVNYPISTRSFTDDGFYLAADIAANFKMTTEEFWAQPYMTAGVGLYKYRVYYGGFIPLGLGLKLNLFNEADIFIQSQYRVPVNTDNGAYHFFNNIGVAGVIGKKKEPKVITPPVVPPTPPKDTDGDGITDDKDKCPTVPGVAKYEGCPVPDTDKDGINDEDDKCPTVPGIAANQGCPAISDEVTKTVNYAAQNVYFAVNSTKLLSKSYGPLNEVVKILTDNPSLKLRIDGHTDNTGTDAYNLKLSDGRAASVKSYLVSKGIDESRLESEGFGESQPVADNNTADGRQKNRRVEMKVYY